MYPRPDSELIFGLVGATGTALEDVSQALADALKRVDYSFSALRLIEALHEFPEWRDMPESPQEERIARHMDAGDQFRERLRRKEALAVLALAAISHDREEATGDASKPRPRHAYILRSLKHPSEAEFLRELYGEAFILVSAYSPREARLDALTKTIAASHHEIQVDRFRSEAENLIYRDQADVANAYGQNVRGTFPMGDVFVDSSDAQRLRDGLERFVDLLFGHPFHTPSKDEYAMFHAQSCCATVRCPRQASRSRRGK